MLRNIYRAVTTKQALVADQTSLSSPTKTPPSPFSSFLNSPVFFNGFLCKNPFDTKSNLRFENPFATDKTVSKVSNPSPQANPTAQQETKAIGLALIGYIIQENCDEGESRKYYKPVNRAALYGSKLKARVPNANPTTPSISQKEPPKSQALSPFPSTPDQDFSRQLSLREMELSEDYTCVISHGSNPKITHIFDNCVVERCLGDRSVWREDLKMGRGLENSVYTSPSLDFLSFCYTCKDTLGQGKDIYIYRGEKAFCSHECRCQEMFFEGLKNPDMDE